jgi:hypothetical protein
MRHLTTQSGGYDPPLNNLHDSLASALVSTAAINRSKSRRALSDPQDPVCKVERRVRTTSIGLNMIGTCIVNQGR